VLQGKKDIGAFPLDCPLSQDPQYKKRHAEEEEVVCAPLLVLIKIEELEEKIRPSGNHP
jgi:hypothetical protein